MVVAFHAGLPVVGGFAGVDVFFVISGFVITGMLQREWAATGRIRFGTFYLRRFKRLTPALALVVGVTATMSALALSPLGPQQTAAKTAMGAMVLAANWAVATTTGGYFDAAAETNPLLNTWTLSVEEQFYLVFPAILALGWFLAPKSWRLKHMATVLVGLVAVASFGLAVIGSTGESPPTASWLLGFYSPLTRAWEFAVGALLALAGAKLIVSSRTLAVGLGLLGVGTFAASLKILSGATPFPSAWTLFPVVGTCLLLLAGTHTSNVVSRALALRPMVKIGDWSYSIYLWHWPCIVFTALLWPDTPRAPIIAAVLSFVPAIVSYTWIEAPIRNKQSFTKRRLAALVAVVTLSPILIAATVASAATYIWTPRYEAGNIPVAFRGSIGQDAWHRYMDDVFYPCTPRELRNRALRFKRIVRCHQSKRRAPVSIAVIGDSHAEHLFPGLAEAIPAKNVVYYIVNGPFLDNDRDVERIVNHVSTSSSISTIVVSAFWYFRGVHRPELLSTLEALSVKGKNVFVTDDIPFFSFEPFGCKYRRARLLPTKCSRDAERFWSDYSLYYEDLLMAVRQVPRVQILNTARYFCGRSTCDMTRDRLLLYRDHSHLNITGSRFLARRLLRDNPAFAASATRGR